MKKKRVNGCAKGKAQERDPERLDTYAHMVTAFVAAGVGGGE